MSSVYVILTKRIPVVSREHLKVLILTETPAGELPPVRTVVYLEHRDLKNRKIALFSKLLRQFGRHIAR